MAYSLIFWILAAICNAVMDTITHHWNESIFDKPKGEITKWDTWWNPEYSWLNKYTDRDSSKPIRKILGIFDIPFTDAWHTFKSLMIVFIVLAIVSAWAFGPPLLNVWWFYLIAFIWLGILWNGVFNLFYNHILR